MMAFSLDHIVSWAKRRGFIYQGSEIYGGLANAWDFGPYGSALKKNIADAWRKFFVADREDMVGMDAQILMHPRVWEASGHVGNFNDPMIDCKKCKSRFRADKLAEEKISHLMQKMSEEEVRNHLLKEYDVKNLIPDSWSLDQLGSFLSSEQFPCPQCKAKEWTDVRKFNMMFSTYQGVVQDDANKVWLRPETAQGIFVNFRNVCDTTRMRIPFGIGQIGKAFRNEITPGNFLYRTREFEQMEIEYFVENDENKAFEHFAEWKKLSQHRWLEIMQIKKENIRFRDHESDELSHYSKGTVDVEYQYPRGWGELQGIAYRGDFDMAQHQEFSQKDLQYHDPKTGKRYLPHVIEPSFGLNRGLLALLLDCYDEETLTNKNGEQDTRVVVRFPRHLAPVRCAILPLMEKDDRMVELGRKIFNDLKKDFKCDFDLSGAIGKRYRRQDEIGTPYCVTIDHQSLEDNTVTIRDRDTMEQKRVNVGELQEVISN